MNKTTAMIYPALAVFPLFAGIKMGTPFADGAVLQRGMKVPIWGKVTPGTAGGQPSATARGKVFVEFAGQKKSSDVGADGTWRVELDSMTASKEGRTMTVISGDDRIDVKDILVGEVWFASGQSNMECPIWGGDTRYRDMKGGLMTTMTKLPNVRYVKCACKWSVEPKELSAKWCKFTPDDLQLFHRESGGSGMPLSAVAFYYARELYLALDVPVGILDASWGGTNIDAWTPRSGYDGCDESLKESVEYPVKSDWNVEVDKKGAINGPNQQPTVLYNGMVASFAPMAMRGFIWYQGCHNDGESDLYCAKLHALYNGWSREFANPDLRIYIVQLAPWKHNWLGICMEQTKFCAEEKNAALAVTADIGNFDDIHPNDKEIVSKRLVVHALKRDYGFAIPEDDSPVLKSASFTDGKITLTFGNVKDWYIYAPNRSRELPFEVAGADGAWKLAKVLNFRKRKGGDGKEHDTDFIDGTDIVLFCEAVPEPLKVRYMGQPRTMGTLYNEASLPLGPFEACAK